MPSRKKIAVFNHSPQLLKLYAVNLDARGYDVHTHIESATNVEIIIHLCPDLIVLGNVKAFTEEELSFIYAVRQTPEIKAIPLIIATTSGQLFDERIQELPQMWFIKKPFDVNLLVATVREALAR